ncbi:hypothetical protein [Sorangium sp. So ce145]|uniref:hypothetical protein n=1 Tax=Sorangium sp. So ce145 TaxID=3133285 RepID=UPI003F5F20B9
MSRTRATYLFLGLPLAALGCGTAPGVSDAGGAPCGATSCHDEPPPESVCLEHLAAGILDEGCGVFVAGLAGGGDDSNPGTKAKPVLSVQRAIDLARVGRGRVYVCRDGFKGSVRLPSGVDLLGGFDCWRWNRDGLAAWSLVYVPDKPDVAVTIEPAGPDDVGAADGVSTLADLRITAHGPLAMLVQSSTGVELLRSELRASEGWSGHEGEEWPWPNRAANGPDGLYGGDACSAATVAGGAAVVNPCDGGTASISGKGGDGLPDGAGDGDDGKATGTSDPEHGRGGTAEGPGAACQTGSFGIYGAQGMVGAPGEGIGHITEEGWYGDRAGDGSMGTPGQGGGGGGGRRGGLSVCGAASKGGAGGGSGAAGGCGGRGGRGGENGRPSIGILALHAKVTVRDTVIETFEGGWGGDGGPPEDGGDGGRGAPGGALGDGTWSCGGGDGGRGGDGGYGGPGRGGDSIGIAYLEEDQLTLEGVTFELGPPGKGGVSWEWNGDEIRGEDGKAVRTLRFPE